MALASPSPSPSPPLAPTSAKASRGNGPAEARRLSSFEEARSPLLSSASARLGNDKKRSSGRWRRILGLICLFFTVFLWTASSFLASFLFADNTFSKPYLVTYINTAFFIVPLFPIFIHRAYRNPESLYNFGRQCRRRATIFRRLQIEDEAALKPDSPRLHSHQRLLPNSSDDLLLEDPPLDSSQVLGAQSTNPVPLSFSDMCRLSLEFCFLWFVANYFIAACLSFTTVASSMILTSTSSIFTLLFGVLMRVERFSVRKLLGVLASLTGIVLISSVDLSGDNDGNRGSFPHKSVREIALGDGMALVSAVLYGIYAVFMKKRIGDESRVNMPLFFGLVGLFNVLLLWPGFIVLHFTGVETFQLPPTGRILGIILINSAASFVADLAWAYAVLLTSPIVVTVGLSTTIPLSLVGQMMLNSQTSSAVYWIGAGVVVLSFVFVNHEANDEDAKDQVVLGESREGLEDGLGHGPGEQP